MIKEILIPDIGDFKDVPVIEVLVAPGQNVEQDEALLVLESDKATLDVPSPEAGRVVEIRLTPGDRVSKGACILTLDVSEISSDEVGRQTEPAFSAEKRPGSFSIESVSDRTEHADIQAEVVVLGAGPGGYTAAFRSADLGKKVVLIDRRPNLGGVCLNVGCIPSKALLHAAKSIDDAKAASAHGVRFGKAAVDLDHLRSWKNAIVSRLTAGLAGLARRRKVTVIHGEAQFCSAHSISVSTSEGIKLIAFDQAIIAAGSEPASLPLLPKDDPRVIDSTGAVAIETIPSRMLVLGGGVIGLEMATVYAALGARVTIVEMSDQIIPGADKDLVHPLMKRLEQRCESILLKSKVTAVTPGDDGLVITVEGPEGKLQTGLYDQLLVAVGRVPNGTRVGAEATGVMLDERGFILVNDQMRTNVPNIYAIGDIVGQPMLAHKAAHQGKVAAEAAAGIKSGFDARVIPAVAYTDPEVAWAGLTEAEARAKGIKFGVGKFPWAASGRALSMDRSEGLTKLLFEEETGRLLGAGVVGPGASDLIAEVVLAIEMGADASDIGHSIHPHPTLAETIAFAADAFEGVLTDL